MSLFLTTTLTDRYSHDPPHCTNKETDKERLNRLSRITQLGSSRAGCGPEKGWTINKAEHRRIDAFELWCWRRLLRVSWTARRSNQSILKEISPEYSLEGLMLKLKLQYFGHLM